METIFSTDHRLRASKTELTGGQFVPPFECPERMDYILASIEQAGLGAVNAPNAMGMAEINQIHDADFLAFLETAWAEWTKWGFEGEAIPTVWPSRSMPSGQIPRFIDGKLGYYALAAETTISEGTFEAAMASAQVALTGAERVNAGARAAFALCRPPGHHASTDQYGGYCFINNAAVAAQYMRNKGAKRVAVLDVDFHHGNGTQEIFYDRDDVLFVSLHGDPMDVFPHFLGHADEHGTGAGAGFTVNYPMPPRTPYAVWRVALEDAIAKIMAYAPDALVISLGVDTFEKDPISFFKLKSADFTDMGAMIAAMNLPSLFVMEGGYAVAEIGVNTVNVLTGFEGG